jgi:ureidoglycolate lyase
MIKLNLLEPSRENFAPFGDLITLDGAEHFPINQGSTERFHALSKVDVGDEGGKPIISLFRGKAFHLPFKLRVMERHPLGSQSFIPVTTSSTNQYLVIVAPATCQTEEEITQNLHAFLVKGFRGVTYAKGVWHHPLISLDEEQDFIVVDRSGPGNNCDEISITQEITVTS